MATIAELLSTIETAIYGKDLRAAIVESIKILNEELGQIDGSSSGSSSESTSYTLPIATAETLGGIKIGTDLSVSEDGTLSVSPELSKSDIGKFLYVNLNKEIDKVQLTGGIFTLGDTGLEYSLAGKIELSQLIYNLLLTTTDNQNISLDDMTEALNMYSTVVTLSDEYNAELYEKFEKKASLGFLTTFSFTKSNMYLMQIVYPIITDGSTTPIVTRSKVGDAEWGSWSSSAQSDITEEAILQLIETHYFSTWYSGSSSIDDFNTDHNTHVCLILLSSDVNSELYELFEGKAEAAFCSVYVSTLGTKRAVQVAYPVISDVSDGKTAPVATRSKLGDAEWSEWHISIIDKSDIETADVGLYSDVSLDDLIAENNMYSGITSISEEQNTELYYLYGEDVPVVFISTRNFKWTDSENPVIYSRQTAYPFSNPELDLTYPSASRIGIYTLNDDNTVWSAWKLDNSGSETDTEIIDITEDFGTWSDSFDFENMNIPVFQVTKAGNVINGTIGISGEFADAYFNVIVPGYLFTVAEKYRPVLNVYLPNVMAFDVSSGNQLNGLCLLTNNGRFTLGLSGESSKTMAYISFTYICE